MDFAAATQAYLNLRHRRDKRDLSDAEFERLVADLTVDLADGTRWRIAADGAGWLRWDGAMWAPARRPAEPTGTSPGSAVGLGLPEFRPPLRPASLRELVATLVSATIASALRTYLIVFAVISVAAWVFNAYLMTKLDPGGLVGLLMTIFSAKDSVVTKTILWIVLGAAVTTILLRVRRQGPQVFRRDLAATPQLVMDVRARAGIAGDAWLLGAAAASLLFCTIVGGRLTALTMAVWIFATLSLKGASLLFLAVWLAWQDMGKGRAGPVGQAPDANVVFAAMVGLALGSGVAFVLPWQPWAGIIVAGGALAICLTFCLASRRSGQTPSPGGEGGGAR